MKYFKVGMSVWCAIYGEGVVKDIDDNPPYNVVVLLKDGEYIYCTPEGRLYYDSNITLSTKPLQPIVNEPLIEFNLTFAEAMEAVADGKKAQYALWGKNIFVVYNKTESSYFQLNSDMENNIGKFTVRIDEVVQKQ
jgi:hypothetical protein